MRLLILTQKVDKKDPVLGFFHAWIEEFARRCDKVTVIALGVGEYDFSGNVKILTLGKELRTPLPRKIWRFYKYIWQEGRNYDAVFVHMNQEYVLLGGPLWKIMGKKVLMWRNHAQGSPLTDLAILLSNKVFYTSPRSYTAKSSKSIRMPVGIDTEFYKPDPNVERISNSILFLGRISPVKKVKEFIGWVNGTSYTATLAGPILDADKEYGEFVLKSLGPNIKYVGPVDPEGALKLYQTHEFYANKTPAGSFDKTIFEAQAAGCKLMVDNPDFDNIKHEDHSLKTLIDKVLSEA